MQPIGEKDSVYETFATVCKICGKPGTAQVDTRYLKMGDPANIVPNYCHDRCFDLRERRIKLELNIGAACRTLENPKKKDKTKAEIRDTLIQLTKAYAQWFADSAGLKKPIWDECMVTFIMQNPEKWATTLWEYRKQLTEDTK